MPLSPNTDQDFYLVLRSYGKLGEEASFQPENASLRDVLNMIGEDNDVVQVLSFNLVTGRVQDASEDVAREWLAKHDGEAKIPDFIENNVDDLADILAERTSAIAAEQAHIRSMVSSSRYVPA